MGLLSSLARKIERKITEIIPLVSGINLVATRCSSYVLGRKLQSSVEVELSCADRLQRRYEITKPREYPETVQLPQR